MVYAFDDFRLDADARELRRRGVAVTVAPQVFDVLEYLLRHRDRIVSRDDLIAGVWDGRIVSDSAIASRIAAVRDVIGDSGKAQRLVRTLSRRGYRFIAPVNELSSGDGGHGTGARRPQRPKIAVLAFVGLPKASRRDDFVKGLAEDIITALSQIPWLQVAARSAGCAYDGWSLDVGEAGAALGAGYLLEGSVREAGNRLRVTARLVEVESGSALWARRFDVWHEDVFALQDLITARVVGELGARLEQREIERCRQLAESDDPVQYHLRGLGYLYSWTRDALDRGLGHFEKAIALDPAFAAPYGMAAYCYVQRKSYGWIADRDAANAECGRLVQAVAELRSADALTLSRAAHAIASVVGDTDSGERLVERALQLDPGLPVAWYVSGWIKLFHGEHRRAAEELTRAIALGPYDLMRFKMHAALAYALFFLGDYDAAALYAAKGLRARPLYLTAMRGAAACHALAGRRDEARGLMAQIHAQDPALSLANLPDLIPFRRPQDMAKWHDALGLAGLPD